MSEPQVPSVPAGEVPDDAVVLDVREDDEWAAGHVPGSRHLPMGQLPARLDDLPLGEDVVVVCRTGHRSGHVAAYLIGSGWRARNLEGGLRAWAAAGRPLTSDTGAAPTVR